VLLLRLERIGDLLMTLGAIDAVRQTWPGAEIDLAVGRWNHALAALIPGLSRIEPADAPWLARPG
jgi:ADP-heptose:LPS heptosyltransferase